MVPFKNTLSEPLEPIYWTDVAWDGELHGDMTLEFEGYVWKVRKDVVTANFPWIQAELERRKEVRTSTGVQPSICGLLLMKS